MKRELFSTFLRERADDLNDDKTLMPTLVAAFGEKFHVTHIICEMHENPRLFEVEANLHFEFDPDDKKPVVKKKQVDESDTYGEYEEPIHVLRPRGVSVVPMQAPYSQMVLSGEMNAIRNALILYGAPLKMTETVATPIIIQAVAQQQVVAQAPATGNGSASVGENAVICEECGAPILPYLSERTGKTMYTGAQVTMTRSQYGKALCRKCNGVKFALSKGKK
jgi:hypothetical protein